MSLMRAQFSQMSGMPAYRVRGARVDVCNGYRCWRERRFLAERRISLFGVFAWWWPVMDGDWRKTASEARRDAERDEAIRAPMSPDEFFTTSRSQFEAEAALGRKMGINVKKQS